MIKPIALLVAVITIQTACLSQANHVFTGAEIVNYGIVDISAVDGIAWSTDRVALPGFFSFINDGLFTGCDDDANINGYVKKYGNTSFIFPVGNGSDLRFLEISAPYNSTDAYATAWIEGNPSLNYDPTPPNAGPHSINAFTPPIVAVSNVGQWDWMVGEESNLGSGTTGTGSGINIMVSIPNVTSFSSTYNLRLVGWYRNRWIDLSGGPTASGNIENSTLRGVMIPGISAIGIGRVASSLAVEIEYFTGIASDCSAKLNWLSYNETNIDNYVIEKSIDGVHFETLIILQAQHSSNNNHYSIEVSQTSNLSYYRLKILEINGTFTYSDIIAVTNHCTNMEFAIVYPNPLSNYENLHLDFTTSHSGQIIISVINNLGQIAWIQSSNCNHGTNRFEFNLNSLPAGSYILHILKDEGEIIGKQLKFIKQ